MDVGGQDATEAFEDVGHSDEARETLDQLEIGTLKRQVRLSRMRHRVISKTSRERNLTMLTCLSLSLS